MAEKRKLIPDSLFRKTDVPTPGAPTGSTGTVQLQLIDPNPNQPRKVFDPIKLEELKHSLAEKGLIEPIVIRPSKNGRFLIVCGERRYRAALELGWVEIGAVIREVADDNEAFELALLENIQRADLTPVEEAEAFSRMIETGMVKNQSELAERLGVSKQTISVKMSLHALPVSIKGILSTQVDKGVITETHFRNFHKLKSEESMLKVAHKVIEDGLSVQATNELIEHVSSGKPIGDQQSRNMRIVRYPFKPFRVVDGKKHHGIFIKDDSSKFLIEAKGASKVKIDDPNIKEALDKLFSAVFG